MLQESGRGRRRDRRRVGGALLTTAAVCVLAACSWGGEPSPSEGVPPDQGSSSTGGGGGGGGGSPVRMSTAAQQKGLPFEGVHDTFVEEMTAECGGTLCVTVVPDPEDADDTCTYAGSDPPWREYVDRGSTVVLLADCDGATTDPGGTETGTGGDSDGTGEDDGS
ncbi:hypothetical protein IF650_13900 [Cellulosimicrobium terreum]|nr:hypothetical protein [Cellulosimicrobium terreum]